LEVCTPFIDDAGGFWTTLEGQNRRTLGCYLPESATAAYVKGANDTLERLAESRDKGEFGGLVGLEKTFAFNLSGHVLHTIF
jgi:hypothetical protein